MALCLMKRLQEAGNKPIALIGGGTAMIGDPSGRTDMRQMMTEETIAHNVACFKEQMSRFIDFSEGKAMMVNNAEWLLGLNYVEFLREHEEAYEDSVEMEEYLEDLSAQWEHSHNGILLQGIHKEKELRKIAEYQNKLRERTDYLKDAYREIVN